MVGLFSAVFLVGQTTGAVASDTWRARIPVDWTILTSLMLIGSALALGLRIPSE